MIIWYDAVQFSAEYPSHDMAWRILDEDKNVRKLGAFARMVPLRVPYYEAFMLADDDMRPIGCTVADTFEAFARSGARVGHPAIVGHYAHECTRRAQDWHVPHARVPFIELMAPMFTRAALLDYMPHFTETVHGWGQEQLWAQREEAAGRHCVRLDATPWEHTRPIAQTRSGPDPKEEGRAFMRRHGIVDRS
jgi:hypothetical protein